MDEDILQRFDFHAATEVTKPQHKAIRAEHKKLAAIIIETVPDSRERSLALTALQDSMMWCNAAIAYRS
jgi:hypothetical protein